jgi:RimJ/RimL family protein N-acetyltransferase
MLRLWSVVPLHEDGQIIGGVLIKENELHVGYGEKPRASIRPYIKEILGGVIGKYGFAMTTVQADNPAGLRFCERLGFVKLGEENGTIRLRCDRSNYL